MARKRRRASGARVPAAEKRRLFAAAYIANEGNGAEAARAAGYTGTPQSLATAASRLLKYADIRAAIEKHTDALVDAMGIPEILKRLTELGRSDLSNFMVKITPEMAQRAIAASGSDEQKARYALAVVEGRGLGLDLPTAIANGHGQQLKSVTFHHDSAGMPTLKIEVHDPRPTLLALAKIRAIPGMRDKEVAAPPPRNAVVIGQLNLLPSAVLEVLNAHLEAKMKELPA